MVTFPHCKINLGLHVVAKRPDGYHDLETCFYPVPWTDILEIIPANDLQFSFSGTPIAGPKADNLCIRAYKLLHDELGLPPVHLHLHKAIPAGSGLGGGSSDGAATLLLLNQVFSLNLGKDRLKLFAVRLGSDAPFFIEAQPMIGVGKGEMLSPQPLPLKGKFLMVVCPEIHSATADAYRHIVPRPPQRRLKNVLEGPHAKWKNDLINDFEAYLFKAHPSLSGIRDKLYSLGAFFAGLSGSGSALFGLFDQPPSYGEAFYGMKVWAGTLTQ